jgi:hypothetical protein
MTVAWVGAGERWDDAALAVACRTCNAEIGKPCDWAVQRTICRNKAFL